MGGIVLPATGACIDSGAIAMLAKENSLGGSTELMIIVFHIWGLKCLWNLPGEMPSRQLKVWVWSLIIILWVYLI